MFNGFWKHASKSQLGTSLRVGIGEAHGFDYKWNPANKTYINQGFLGRLSPKGISGGSVLSFGLGALSVMHGYNEDGLSGAVSMHAQNIAMQTILKRATWSAIGAPVVGALAVGALGYGAYKLGNAAIHSAKRFRNLEMGADINDTFGTMATMRQRSISAIQNSHVNGRFALGYEAQMMHSPMMR